jgi:hypothetical protein
VAPGETPDRGRERRVARAAISDDGRVAAPASRVRDRGEGLIQGRSPRGRLENQGPRACQARGRIIRSSPLPELLGGGGQPTAAMTGDSTPLRKVPAPRTTGADGSPPGESPSSGAETTQPAGARMASRRRTRRDMMKRPSPREQALSDGMRRSSVRRGERGVECCLKQNGAYYRHLAGSSVKRGAVRPETPVSGRRTVSTWFENRVIPSRMAISFAPM